MFVAAVQNKPVLAMKKSKKPQPFVMTTNEDTGYLTSTAESDVSNSWMDEFMLLPGSSALTRVPQEFIEDRFNLIGLNKDVPNADKALRVLRGELTDSGDYNVATLYYMIHQRYIFTKQGQEEIFEKVLHNDYGVCRNIACASTKLIPLGLTDLPEISHIKLYCHNCKVLFQPKRDIENLDGCAFGRSFPHFLIMTYKSHFPKSPMLSFLFGYRCWHFETN